jgi:hypothetical protein
MPSEQITIGGKSFNVPLRYEEGHELSAGEASALNQTFHENIRNNLAKAAKDGTLTQEAVDQYASGYQFGVRAGGATRDPVQAEAMRIAKAKITAALKGAGKKVADVEVSALNAAAKALIDRDPQITQLAQQRVQEQQALATGDLADLIGNLQAVPQSAPETTQPA